MSFDRNSAGLREEIDTILGRANADDLPILRRLARGTVRRIGGAGDAADDLLGDFAVDLLTGRSKGRHSLLNIESPDILEAAVRNRMRQLAVARRPRWNLVRGLRRQVAVALKGRPEVPASAPGSLQVGKACRLSQERVSEAVAWLLAQPESPGQDLRAVSKSLLEIYFPEIQRSEKLDLRVKTGATDPETAARRRFDVDRLFEEMRRRLPEEKIVVLQLWAAGHTYGSIAESLNISIATAHAWLQVAAAYLRHLVVAESLSLGTIRALLEGEFVSRDLSLPGGTSSRLSLEELLRQWDYNP